MRQRMGALMGKTSPDSFQATGFDVESFIEQHAAEHERFTGERLARLRQLACEAAEANAGVAELADMDQKIGCFCNDLPECFRREEQMVFPALLRLGSLARISSCKAGMVAARLRFMVAEQQMLLSALANAIEILERHLSPVGPCESCHGLLREAKSLESELVAHIRREQAELFTWGVAREVELVQDK
jgi:iron-sulfur cluster repair protein YtfE (RIC family)